MDNLVSCGFKGELFPVNPKYNRVSGFDAVARVENLKSHVDMAVIAVPMQDVPGVVAWCGQKKMRGSVVISAGPVRPGDPENEIWSSMQQVVRDTGIRIIGPDSVGIINTRAGVGFDPCEDEIYDALFQRAGILRVHGFDALFDCAEFLAKQKRPRGARLAIVSNAGGIGLMAVDALAGRGIKPADLTPSTIHALDGLLEDRWPRTNPIEVLQETSPEKYIQVVKTCIKADEIDGLLLLSSPVGTYDSTALASPLVELLKTTPFPVFTAWMGGGFE